MSSLEMLQLAIKAITDAAAGNLIDAAKHPHTLEIDHGKESASIQVSIKSLDGTKVKTYCVSVTLTDEF